MLCRRPDSTWREGGAQGQGAGPTGWGRREGSVCGRDSRGRGLRGGERGVSGCPGFRLQTPQVRQLPNSSIVCKAPIPLPCPILGFILFSG